MPPVINRLTDIEIPRSAWSSWIPSEGKRQLRRPLSIHERDELERRRAELAIALEPFHPQEKDHIALALSDMFGGFTSMRQGDEDAAARLDSVIRLLSEFPAWAISKACRDIQMNGVYRDKRFDKRWPPNDAEIVDEVRRALRLYGDQHRIVGDLLEATVEKSTTLLSTGRK